MATVKSTNVVPVGGMAVDVDIMAEMIRKQGELIAKLTAQADGGKVVAQPKAAYQPNKALTIEKQYPALDKEGNGDLKASVNGRTLTLTINLLNGGNISKSGKTTVQQSGSVVLSDGSKLQFTRFTPVD